MNVLHGIMSDLTCEDYCVPQEQPATFRYLQSHEDWFILEKWNGKEYKEIDQGHSLDWPEFARHIGFKDIVIRVANHWDDNDEPIYDPEYRLK